MTNTATDTTSLRAPLAAAATAVAGGLPSSVPLTAAEPPGDEMPRAALVPGEGARAVVASVGGALTGRLLLAVSSELAASIERDPLAGGLEADVGPVLEQAGTAFAEAAGLDLTLADLQELPAAEALAETPGTECVAVPLLAGETHAATMALIIAQPSAPQAGVAPPPEAAIPEPEVEVASHEFQPLDALAAAAQGGSRSLEFLGEVELGVTAELGRARMSVRNVLSLVPGAIVELDKAAGSPVDVLVNGTLIARGEVVVVDEEFGIRITEIVGSSPADAIS
jgi:flagellar motor switch protein FliN/FliY